MIFLGQTAFQSWPPKPVTNWASSLVQSPSLALLNSYPPTRLSSAASWNTVLSSGMVPLPHTLVTLTPWKPRPSKSSESPAMKLSRWSYHFAITDRSMGYSVFFHHLSGLEPSALSMLCLPQVSAQQTWSISNPFRVKLPKSRITAPLYSFVPIFSPPVEQLPHSFQSHSSFQVFKTAVHHYFRSSPIENHELFDTH